MSCGLIVQYFGNILQNLLWFDDRTTRISLYDVKRKFSSLVTGLLALITAFQREQNYPSYNPHTTSTSQEVQYSIFHNYPFTHQQLNGNKCYVHYEYLLFPGKSIFI